MKYLFTLLRMTTALCYVEEIMMYQVQHTPLPAGSLPSAAPAGEKRFPAAGVSLSKQNLPALGTEHTPTATTN